jgi:hypothetical protein
MADSSFALARAVGIWVTLGEVPSFGSSLCEHPMILFPADRRWHKYGRNHDPFAKGRST